MYSWCSRSSNTTGVIHTIASICPVQRTHLLPLVLGFPVHLGLLPGPLRVPGLCDFLGSPALLFLFPPRRLQRSLRFRDSALSFLRVVGNGAKSAHNSHGGSYVHMWRICANRIAQLVGLTSFCLCCTKNADLTWQTRENCCNHSVYCANFTSMTCSPKRIGCVGASWTIAALVSLPPLSLFSTSGWESVCGNHTQPRSTSSTKQQWFR